MMLRVGLIISLVFSVLAISAAFAADEPGTHVYASIADRVESGEINCACPDLSEMTVGCSDESSVWERHFSGMVRLRWQLADNGRNTGMIPWARVEVNYHTEFEDNWHLFLGVGGDTEADAFFLGAPRSNR